MGIARNKPIMLLGLFLFTLAPGAERAVLCEEIYTED